MNPEIKQYDIREAIYADWNYKIDNHETLQKLVLNVLEDGLLSFPIVRINEDGQEEVIDGNHRKQAIELILKIVGSIRKKGDFEEKVARLYTEKNYDFYQIPVVYVGKIPLAQAKKIAVKLNETRFENDPKLLGQTLIDIVTEYSPDVFEEIPFDIEEYELLAARALDDAKMEIVQPPERIETDVRTIKVECTKETYDLWISCKQRLGNLGIESEIEAMQIILHEFSKIPASKIKI